jgi:metal-responsive CopG/Arc/MetJ family transcriptional regulator
MRKRGKISISIENEINEKLTKICDDEFINKSRLINSLIKDWINKKELDKVEKS